MQTDQSKGGWARARILVAFSLAVVLLAGVTLLLAQEFRLSSLTVNPSNQT